MAARMPTIYAHHDIRVDDVDSGAPCLTFVCPQSGKDASFRLAPDAVAAIVDALIGVAPVGRGQARVIVKIDADALARAILAAGRVP